MDGQAKLAWVAGLNINMAYPQNIHLTTRHRVIQLICTMPLRLCQNTSVEMVLSRPHESPIGATTTAPETRTSKQTVLVGQLQGLFAVLITSTSNNNLQIQQLRLDFGTFYPMVSLRVLYKYFMMLCCRKNSYRAKLTIMTKDFCTGVFCML